MDWILSKLGSGAADELSQHLALKGDIRKLRTTLPRIRTLIDKAECWSWKHKDLAELLTQLKDAAYDAGDLLDDFDYQDLQHKIEGEQSEASRTLPSSLNVAINAISSATNSVRDLARNFISGATEKVRDVKGRLDDIAAEMEAVIKLLHLDDESKQYGMSVRRETSSFLIESEVFGRDEEREKVIKLLLNSGDGSGSSSSVSVPPTKRRKTENVSVLPLVGIGGVGKTTLAQLVYNDQRVKDHFEPKMWVCVSNYFDVTRITTEMIGKQPDTRNLNSLQMILKEKVMSRRFLLILDDVWNEESEEWKRLVAPLRSGLQGSMILLTTRSQKVADITGTMEPIVLKGLPKDAYWECFKTCAFGLEKPEDYPELKAIGEMIAAKLNGFPLAAKTLGGLLYQDMNPSHWRTIMNSEMWELPQKEYDILPALRLSYQYLPAHLKRCFRICSMFPKDDLISIPDLIYLWLAQGYILPQGNMVLEDIGTSYFNELLSRSFLQPSHIFHDRYVMHDLIHDLSQSVSQSECFTIQNENLRKEIVTTTRHLAINNEAIEPSKLTEIGNFNKLQSLLIVASFKPDWGPPLKFWFNRLTSIRYFEVSYCKIEELPESIGNLKHLRYLDISRTRVTKLPEAVCRLHNLLFLGLEECPIACFPEGFSNLINLRCLILSDSMIVSKITNIGKLTSLQNLKEFEVLKQRGHMIEELKDMKQLRGSLSIRSLENIENKEDARQAKLNNKEYLDELILQWSYCKESSRSEIGNLDLEVEGVLEELQPHPNLKRLEIRGYRGAKLSHWMQTQMLPYLSSLTLEYCPQLTEIPSLSPLSSLTIKNCPQLMEIPSLNFLRNLNIKDCPQLMQIPLLTSLSCLAVKNCPHIEISFLASSISELALVGMRWDALSRLWDGSQSSTDEDRTNKQGSSLSKIHIQQCANLTSLEEWLPPHCLHRTLKSIHIRDCEELVTIPVERFKDIISLEILEIADYPKLNCPKEMLLPISIKILELDNCGDLGKSLPNCLVNLTALTDLTIRRCPHVASLVWRHLTALEYLVIRECENMRSLEGIQVLQSLKSLDIRKCPKLIESDPLVPSGEVQGRSEGMSSLHFLSIENTAVLKLSFLRSPPLSLRQLIICNSPEHVMFTGEGHEWLRSLKSLNRLLFVRCLNLQSLPAELHSMTSLENLGINSCPEIQSLPAEGLPTSLLSLKFSNCHPMLTEQLEKYKALMNLR
ncbi:putative disease resistance protein RGA3 [Typha latifolia]|uniref:putative disease resistance protein RGA3 n=1 Tax=Typha latifolia TaxID=4733 RepID=UPI003C2B10C6